MEQFQENLAKLMATARKRAVVNESVLPPPTSKPEKEPYDVGGAELKKLFALMPKRK